MLLFWCTSEVGNISILFTLHCIVMLLTRLSLFAVWLWWTVLWSSWLPGQKHEAEDEDNGDDVERKWWSGSVLVERKWWSGSEFHPNIWNLNTKTIILLSKSTIWILSTQNLCLYSHFWFDFDLFCDKLITYSTVKTELICLFLYPFSAHLNCTHCYYELWIFLQAHQVIYSLEWITIATVPRQGLTSTLGGRIASWWIYTNISLKYSQINIASLAMYQQDQQRI